MSSSRTREALTCVRSQYTPDGASQRKLRLVVNTVPEQVIINALQDNPSVWIPCVHCRQTRTNARTRRDFAEYHSTSSNLANRREPQPTVPRRR